VAGIRATEADEPVHWHVQFAVADRDESASAAEHRGATVLSSTVTPWTREALIRDPQGAELTLSQFAPSH
jgi:predicted enzyme related to lactoylglutathione lyase